MPPKPENSPNQNQAAKQANYARRLGSEQLADKRQDNLPPPSPVSRSLPQSPAQESSREESSDEEQPINHSFPQSQVQKDEEPNVARQLRDKIEQARKEYVQKIVKETAKQVVKKGWQWLLRSAIIPVLAFLGGLSWWIWLIILVGILIAALALYAKNDPCGFIGDAGEWSIPFMIMIKMKASWLECIKF